MRRRLRGLCPVPMALGPLLALLALLALALRGLRGSLGLLTRIREIGRAHV